jgi:predicted dehydrogenase
MNSKTKYKKVLLVGLGIWGNNIYNCLRKISNVKIVGICDKNFSNIKKYVKKLNFSQI